MKELKKRQQQQLCKQCRQCIYQWANSCPGLAEFSRQACAQASSK